MSIGASTHTGVAFQAFVFDLLHYTLPRYGLAVMKLSDEIRGSKKVFCEEFGDAVILFRERHAEEFKERMSSFERMECAQDVLSYMTYFCERIFQDNIPLMELFVFCAFLLDLAIYCLLQFDSELLMDVVDDIFIVFDDHVKEYFTVVGGWIALYQVASQYMIYIHLVTKGNPFAIST